MIAALNHRLHHFRVDYLRLTLLVAMLFTLLAALIFRTPGVLFMAALLWATYPMGTLVARFMSRRLIVTRDAPTNGMAGDIVSGRIRVFNSASTPAFLVHLRVGEVAATGAQATAAQRTPNAAEKRHESDTLEAAPPSASALLSAKVTASNSTPDTEPTPNTSLRTTFDERRDWPIVLLDETERIVPVLLSQERIEWKPRWKLQRRGIHRLPPVQLGVRDPLGVFSRLEAKTEAHIITVLPQPIRLQRLGFLGGGQSSPSAPQQAVAVAEALDFHGIRAWQSGQPIRRVHWKSTARTGSLHIVEWEESFGSDLTVLIDARVATNDAAVLDEALEAAVTLTASVAAHLLENGYHFQMFYWQAPPATDDDVAGGNIKRGTTASAANAADKASPFKRAQPEPVLHHRQARRAGDLKEILTALAQLAPVPNERWSPAVTLSSLARQAAPSLARSGALLIAPTSADIADAVVALGAAGQGDVGGTQVHVLALDAASFAPKSDTKNKTDFVQRGGASNGGASNGQAAVPAAPNNSYGHGARTRVVRRGDSLAAALERE